MRESGTRVKLKPYAVFERGSKEDGAVLAFASTAREAKKLGWPYLRNWFDTLRRDVVAERLAESEHIMRQRRCFTEAHAIESPDSCPCCGLWGRDLRTYCADCGGYEDANPASGHAVRARLIRLAGDLVQLAWSLPRSDERAFEAVKSLGIQVREQADRLPTDWRIE